jgi:hypothetical protein
VDLEPLPDICERHTVDRPAEDPETTALLASVISIPGAD